MWKPGWNKHLWVVDTLGSSREGDVGTWPWLERRHPA